MANISSPLTARPTIYKGIEMRSRLEAWWARAWDHKGIDWTYEPNAFGSEYGQYLPDFRISDRRPNGTERVCYVELKGVVVDPAPFLRRMQIIWSSQPEAILFLIENHGERVWMGSVKEDGSSDWCEHDVSELSAFSDAHGAA